MIAVVERAGEPCLLVIREFRPVLGAHELSLPAGIIDPGEDAATGLKNFAKKNEGTKAAERATAYAAAVVYKAK